MLLQATANRSAVNAVNKPNDAPPRMHAAMVRKKAIL
jgi:hypothetical protein